MTKPAVSAEVAVVGGGPSGLIAALALAAAGADTILLAPPAAPDRRTTALLDGSVRVLDALGVWARLEPHTAPFAHLRLIDATSRLIRAPEVMFDADELGLEAFGYNIENEILRRELRIAAANAKGLRIIEETVTEVAPDDSGVTLKLASGEERVQLVAAADGRNSICRKAAGIETERRELPQTALAMNLRHTRPHRGISTEFHTESGPFTLVPLAGDHSSLVWVLEPDEAAALLQLDDAALSLAIEKRAHSILGKMEIESGRGAFPLAIETARRFADRRIALIGEAGHVLPPIGAQGLNLGIRDAATIAELVADARRAGADLGGTDLTVTYDERRRPDVRSRALAVELMNRSLLTDFLPVHALRGIGLEIISRFGFLRRQLMQAGLGQSDDAPRLARGEAL
jgi:2-octaprenyl-6-methoxyphenol hydroxylase